MGQFWQERALRADRLVELIRVANDESSGIYGQTVDRVCAGIHLFQKARLINAALIARIHATEWTPALLQSPTLQYAMRGSWWGVLGQAYFEAFGRPLHNELLSGIPSSPQEHYAAPYAITEEFTAVYRLHSLIPDDY